MQTINCNTSTCKSVCDKEIKSSCVIFDKDTCFSQNNIVAFNSCDELVTLKDIAKLLCKELFILQEQVNCLKQIYCEPNCTIELTDINLTN